MNNDIVIQQQITAKKRWSIRLIGVAIGAIVLIMVGVIIWGLIPKDYDKVVIGNRSELSELSDGEVNNMKTELLKVLRDNGLIGQGDEVNDVVVREGTVVSETDASGSDGYHWKTTTFLIDIDSLKQTYAVKIVESNKDLIGITAQIECPKIQESKYPESKCTDFYGTTNEYLEYKLPYELKTDNGEKILVKKVDAAKKNNKWTRTVQVYLYSCEEKDPPAAEAEAIVKKWVESLDDPISDYYTYNIRSGYCEGDAI